MTQAERAILEIVRETYGRRGFRVSSVKEQEDGRVVVRFPKGGPGGLRRSILNPGTIEEMRRQLEDF